MFVKHLNHLKDEIYLRECFSHHKHRLHHLLTMNQIAVKEMDISVSANQDKIISGAAKLPMHKKNSQQVNTNKIMIGK